MEDEIKNTKKIEKKLIKIRADLKEAIEQNDAEKIFKYFGIKTSKDEDGLLTISEFNQPVYMTRNTDIHENKLFKKIKSIFKFKQSLNESLDGVRYYDIGINENKLFEKVKSIGGDASFIKSQLTNLGNLKSIGRDADFRHSQVTDLGKLKIIRGQILYNTQEMEKLLKERGLVKK